MVLGSFVDRVLAWTCCEPPSSAGGFTRCSRGLAVSCLTQLLCRQQHGRPGNPPDILCSSRGEPLAAGSEPGRGGLQLCCCGTTLRTLKLCTAVLRLRTACPEVAIGCRQPCALSVQHSAGAQELPVTCQARWQPGPALLISWRTLRLWLRPASPRLRPAASCQACCVWRCVSPQHSPTARCASCTNSWCHGRPTGCSAVSLRLDTCQSETSTAW